MRSHAILIIFVLAGLVVAFAPLPVQPYAPLARTFHVEASQFAYSPAEISVNPDDTVIIELTSTDVVHGLYVDGYDVSVKSDPGQTATLSFVADRPGAFRIRCNVTCGAMHPFMVGKFNVGANTWLYRSMALAFIGFFSIFILARDENGEIQAL